MSDAATPEVPARPAATVLLLRDRERGGIDVHLQQRRAEMDFGSSAHVFPGGSMDAADASPGTLALVDGAALATAAARMHLDGDGEARRLCAGLHVCAVREVFEEAGLLIGARADGGDRFDIAALAAARDRVLGGGDLGAELRALGARPRVESLVYVAHFITPQGLPRRYDTRFFATRAPLGQEAAFHSGEATLGGWYEPGALLAQHDREEVVLMPPTRIVLEELRRHDSVDAVLADLGAREVASILFSFRHLEIPLPDHLPSVAEVAAMGAVTG